MRAAAVSSTSLAGIWPSEDKMLTNKVNDTNMGNNSKKKLSLNEAGVSVRVQLREYTGVTCHQSL